MLLVAVAPVFLTVRPAPSWSFMALPGPYQEVSSLALGPDGRLCATLQTERDGRIIEVVSGKARTVLAGLGRPDGLHYRDKYLYVTEARAGHGRVIRLGLEHGDRAGRRPGLGRLQAPQEPLDGPSSSR